MVTGIVEDITTLEQTIEAQPFTRSTNAISAVLLNPDGNNYANGEAAVAIGYSCQASGARSFAQGWKAIANGGQSVATGYETLASGSNAHVEGQKCTASGMNSHAGGYGSVASLNGAFARASSYIATPGDAQFQILEASNSTSNATPTELKLGGQYGSRISIATNSVWAFSILVVASTSNCAQVAAYQFDGVIKNANGTVSIVGSVVKTVLGEDDAAWDCDVTADDTNKALAITATGKASTAIRWHAAINMSMVVFP